MVFGPERVVKSVHAAAGTAFSRSGNIVIQALGFAALAAIFIGLDVLVGSWFDKFHIHLLVRIFFSLLLFEFLLALSKIPGKNFIMRLGGIALLLILWLITDRIELRYISKNAGIIGITRLFFFLLFIAYSGALLYGGRDQKMKISGYFIGMSKGDLAERGFDVSKAMEFYVEGNSEWYTFASKNPAHKKGVITFYFVGDSLRSWEPEDIRTMRVMLKIGESASF